MPGFKPKISKFIQVDEKNTITLDSKHNEFVDTFKQNNTTIDTYENKIGELEKHRQQLNAQNSSPTMLLKLDTKIQKLKKKIQKMKQNEINYYLENSKLIFDYFENKKEITSNINKKKIMNNFFNIQQKKEELQNTILVNNYAKEYLLKNDESSLDIHEFIYEYDNCKHCKNELIKLDHEGMMICNNCSYMKPFLIDTEKNNYKEPPREVSFYAYKRINHFREILAQFQAKETTYISDSIIQDIKDQIKKERIDIKNISNDKMKQILKNLGLNKYYEHIAFIKSKLGIKPLTMSLDLENTLCNLFMEIQKPYSKFCPNDRVNFLNYYYVLYKLCELLGEDEYLTHFYMLKDKVKRMEQDEIWKKICNELQWEFIPTP